jgi:hypothetical protein
MVFNPKGLLGDRLAEAAEFQSAANPASRTASPPIHGDRWARNGQAPNASLANKLNEAVNQAVCYRTKQCFYSYGKLGGSRVASSTDEARWWFAFHTGPYHHALHASVAMWPDTDYPVSVRNASSRLDIYSDAALTTLVATQTFVYGTHPTTTLGYAHIKQLTNYVGGLTADTDYYGVWSAVDKGRLIGATVFDLESMTEGYDGYLSQNLTTHSAVLDKYRRDQVTILNRLWRRGGAQVFNWTCETTPQTRSSATLANLFDTTVTTVSAASPGYTLDMTGKTRLSQTSGVPTVMKVLAKVSVTMTGTVKLVDSSGATVMTTSITATTPTWVSVSGFLPATTDKYDLQFSCTGASISVYAVTCFEYEA